MDLSSLLEIPADLSGAALDGSNPGDLFDGQLFHFDNWDDGGVTPQNSGDGAPAQGGGRANYEPPNFFPFNEMPSALKPRPSHFPTLRKVASGALNVGSICETSDKALLLELHRSLQLFTSQQQFLIGQVQKLDQWLTRIYPNATTHQVDGFNVSELLTLDTVTVDKLPEELLQPEIPPSKQKHKPGASQTDRKTSKLLSSKYAAVADGLHVSSNRQVKSMKLNEQSKSSNRVGEELPSAGAGISRQRKKEKNSNACAVTGGGASPLSNVRTALASNKPQLSPLTTAEPGVSIRLIKVKIKCKSAESFVANPLVAQIPSLLQESPSLREATPSSNDKKSTSLNTTPKMKRKEETSIKKAEDTQPPTIQGMWDWVRKEGYFKECTHDELCFIGLQPEYLMWLPIRLHERSISLKLAAEVKKPPLSKTCTPSMKPPERRASLDYACPSAHILIDAGDSPRDASNGKYNDFFTDRLISALLPIKKLPHSKNTVLLNPPTGTTVQKHSEVNLDALTEEQRLKAYLCNVGLLGTQLLEGWQGHHACVDDELHMLAEELVRLNCRNNQTLLWLKEQVCKEVEKQRKYHIEQADSMAKIQRLKELIKSKQKQKDKIGKQQQKQLWPS